MATAQENLARFQEIADRGIQDQLNPDKRARFDEAVRRGLVALEPQPLQGMSAEERQRIMSTPFDPHAETTDPRAGAIAGTERLRDLITGDSKKTPEIEGLEEIGAAPELGGLSLDEFKTSLGLLTTAEKSSVENILIKQFGDEISFDEDEKGSVIATLPSGQYLLNAPGLSGQDAIKFIFDTVAFAPASRSRTIGGAIVKAGGTEGAIEGAETSLGGDFDVENVVAASAMDGGFKGVEKFIGAGYRALTGSATNEVTEAGKEAGVRVLTSDVSPPETFAGKTFQQAAEKIPIVGTGSIRETQQAQRMQAVQGIADKYSQFSYDTVVQSLRAQSNKVKNAAGSVLSSVGSKLDGVGPVDISNTQRAITEAQQALSKKGVIQDTSALNDLALLSETILGVPQTFTTLKENRTAFRDIVNSVDRADRSQLTSRSKALLTNVQNAIREDMTAFARQNLTPKEFSQWQRANAVYAHEAEKLTKTRLKAILDRGDVTPETAENMLFSSKPSEVRALYDGLTPEGRSNARAAIIQKVVRTLSDRQSGLTPNSFATELKKHGMRTDIFFRGDEKKALNGLLKALDHTRRAQDASVSTPTGQQLLVFLFGAGAAIDPVVTGSAAGSLSSTARAYESQPVRDFLLRLDSIPAGSTRFEEVFGSFFSGLRASAQGVRESQTE